MGSSLGGPVYPSMPSGGLLPISDIVFASGSTVNTGFAIHMDLFQVLTLSIAASGLIVGYA